MYYEDTYDTDSYAVQALTDYDCGEIQSFSEHGGFDRFLQREDKPIKIWYFQDGSRLEETFVGGESYHEDKNGEVVYTDVCSVIDTFSNPA